MATFTVDLLDLRAGLVSVLPHVNTSKDAGKSGYVNLVPAARHVRVMAGGGFTVGLALVHVEEHSSEDVSAFQIHHDDVRRVLAVFKAPPKDEQNGMNAVELVADSTEVRFTDVGGLIEGTSLTVPLARHEHFPPFDARLRHLIGAVTRPMSNRPRPVWAHRMQAFIAAGKAYTEPLVLEADDKVLVVRVGESFVGAAGLWQTSSEDEPDVPARSTLDWNTLLPAVEVEPIEEPDPTDDSDREPGSNVVQLVVPAGELS